MSGNPRENEGGEPRWKEEEGRLKQASAHMLKAISEAKTLVLTTAIDSSTGNPSIAIIATKLFDASFKP